MRGNFITVWQCPTDWCLGTVAEVQGVRMIRLGFSDRSFQQRVETGRMMKEWKQHAKLEVKFSLPCWCSGLRAKWKVRMENAPQQSGSRARSGLPILSLVTFPPSYDHYHKNETNLLESRASTCPFSWYLEEGRNLHIHALPSALRLDKASGSREADAWGSSIPQDRGSCWRQQGQRCWAHEAAVPWGPAWSQAATRAAAVMLVPLQSRPHLARQRAGYQAEKNGWERIRSQAMLEGMKMFAWASFSLSTMLGKKKTKEEQRFRKWGEMTHLCKCKKKKHGRHQLLPTKIPYLLNEWIEQWLNCFILYPKRSRTEELLRAENIP